MSKSIAVITGASSGIGKALSQEISKLDLVDELWIIARRKDKLEDLSTIIPVSTKIIVLDLSQLDAIKAYTELLKKHKPNIRLLINNAGLGAIGAFSELPVENIQAMINVNVTALTLLTFHSIPYMAEGSNLILLSSSGGFLPMRNMAVYAATKSYVTNFGSAVYEELKSKGIAVTTVCPGPINTEFNKTAGSTEAKQAPFTMEANKLAKKIIQDSMKKKMLSVYGVTANLMAIMSKFLPKKFLAKPVLIE